jgi:hypothetical protein
MRHPAMGRQEKLNRWGINSLVLAWEVGGKGKTFQAGVENPPNTVEHNLRDD